MKSLVQRPLLLAAATLVAASSAHATDITWGGATGNWIDTTKWTGGVIPGATSDNTNTDVAIFGSPTAANTVTVDANRSIGGITFSGTNNFATTTSNVARPTNTSVR